MKTRFLQLIVTTFLLSTSLFSQEWIPVGQDVLPENFYTWALSAVDENTVFAICENDDYSVQKLVRTIDGGVTWNVVELSLKPGYPQDIHAISADTIWIVYRESSGTTKLYLSTDAGQTLEEKFTYQGNFVIGPALLFGDEESGYMIDPTVIRGSYTIDAGASWQSEAIFSTFASGETWGMANPTNWMDAKGDTIWWGTSKFIHRSKDNGATWQSFDNGFSDGVETKCISFSQSGLGLAASNTNFDVLSVTHISASTDGGTTWTELPIVDLPLEGITDVPGLNDAFVGVGGIFKDFVPGITHQYVSAYTLDGGLNWTVIDSFPLNAVEFISPDAGWAGKILSHEYEGNPVLYKWIGPLTGNRLFVNDDATGANDGTSWADAFTDLQSALAIAEEGDQIWVAEGTYLPGTDPTATFLMDKNLQLYGGFAGTELTLAERGDPAGHPTILSGDLNGDDEPGNFEMYRDDNSSHVVSIAESANGTMLDGFIISGGNGKPATPPAGNDLSPQRGGGMTSLASCSIKNCIFRDNSAVWGGAGCYARFGDEVLFENCAFEGNNAPRGAFNLAFCDDGQIINCQFIGNTGSFGGAGANLGNLNVVVRDCEFTNNQTPGGDGGAIFLWHNPEIEFENPSMTIENCTFTGNQAHWGGGISFNHFIPGGHLELQGCSFDNNAATSDGGGLSVYNDNSGPELLSVTLTNNNFTNNYSSGDGGGVYLFNLGETAIESCVFDENLTASDGAGIYANSCASVLLENCLYTGNSGNTAAVFAELLTNFRLINCTIADNECRAVQLSNAASLEIQNTILANPSHTEYNASANSTATSNGGNLVLDNSLNAALTALDKSEMDPGFMPGSFDPSSTSPLVNAGVNDGVTATTDLAGNERIQHGTVDIGAFESPFDLVSTRELIAGEALVSPNPASAFLNIELPETITGNIEVRLFNTQGRAMSLQTITPSQPVDVKNLSPGFYTLKAAVGDRIYTGKFVKQ